MFLLEPGHTPYDLHFRVAGIPVRVHPMFWLVTAIMGFSAINEPTYGFALFAIWVGCVFFSILIHELGHVVMFQLCGTTAHAVLYAFGGLAVPHRPLYNRWQRIAVDFAGPFAGFLVIAAIAIAFALTDVERLEGAFDYVLLIFGQRPRGRPFLGLHPLVEDAVFNLIWINLFWGLMNLLPIYPLDGGQASRDFLDGLLPGGQGVRVALTISLVLAALLAIHSVATANGYRFIPFLPGLGMFGAIMFGMLAVESFQLLQQHQNPPWRRDDW